MPIATVNGTRINYVQVEDPDGTAREDIVLVHGLATNLAFWYFKYALPLSKRFRVTLFDLRGHGRSEMRASGYAPAVLAEDVVGLLDHLKIDRAHFLTHGFGGVVALSLACAHPERVRSLVLTDNQISVMRHVETPQELAYWQSIQSILDRHGVELDTKDAYFGYQLLTRMAEWRFRGLAVPDELAELVSPLMMGTTGLRTAAQWLRLMDTTTAGAEMMGDDGLSLERLRSLRFPILAMYGDHSQARLSGSELLEVWPHAEFRRVRDAGHFFPASRPEEVLLACERFWGGEFDSASRRARIGGSARRTYFRSNRVVQSDGLWHFITRENNRIGPFPTSDEAHDALARYVSSLIPELEFAGAPSAFDGSPGARSAVDPRRANPAVSASPITPQKLNQKSATTARDVSNTALNLDDSFEYADAQLIEEIHTSAVETLHLLQGVRARIAQRPLQDPTQLFEGST